MRNIIIGIIIIALGVWIVSSMNGTPREDQNINEHLGLAELSGTVTYRERIALPENSRIEVRISDVSRADAEAIVIAETTIVTQGENVPIPFIISYDADQIDPIRSYSVSARILVDGNLRFTTDSYVPLLVDGEPIDSVDLLLVSVGGPVTETPIDTTPRDEEQEYPANLAELSGSTFVMVSRNGENVPEAAEYTLSFDRNSLFAKICNNMGGTVNVSSDGMIQGMLVTTLMFCSSPEGIMDVENALGAMIDGGVEFSLDGDTLTLTGHGNQMVFVRQS